MKKRILGLVIGCLFIGFNGFAADGDLIVNGKVGIGPTSPSTKLDVSGTIRSIDLGTPTSGTGVEIRYNASVSKGYMSTQSRPSGAFGYLELLGTPLILNGQAGGNVGIGNTTPDELLRMEAGTVGGYYTTGTHNFVSVSSGRWKSDIKPITGALDTVLKLNGVSFKWKKRTDVFETVREGEEEIQKYVSTSWSDDPNGRDDVGLIGEDVMKVLPQVVDVDRKDPNYARGLAYSKIVAVLIEAIKEQQKAIEDLRGEVEKLKTR